MGVDVQHLQAPVVRWRELVDLLRLDSELIVDRTLGRLLELPGYRRIAPDDLRAGVLADVQLVLAQMQAGRSPAALSEHSRAVFTGLGELRARQGVAVSDLVHAWRVGCDEVVRRARETVTAGPDGDRLMLRLYEVMLGWLDVAVVASAEGHRQAEVERARQEYHVRAGAVRALLLGPVTEQDLRRYTQEFRLDPTLHYHVVRGRPTADADVGLLEHHLAGRHRGVAIPGLLGLIDGDVCGLVSRLPTEPAPAPIGVSGAVPLTALGRAFATATRLLEAAIALGRCGVIEVSTLGVEAAVVADDEVGEAMLDRYVRPLEALGPAGAMVLDTVARYLRNDCRLDTTARELHVHVNTVRYRLGRFEQVTRRSLRHNDSLVEVWWALRRRSLS